MIREKLADMWVIPGPFMICENKSFFIPEEGGYLGKEDNGDVINMHPMLGEKVVLESDKHLSIEGGF